MSLAQFLQSEFGDHKLPKFETKQRSTPTSVKKRLIIIRGIPGSGKTFLAKKLQATAKANTLTAEICSTDDYFMENGKYVFDPSGLHINHKKKSVRASQFMASSVNVVII